MAKLVECVPNFSEGRNNTTVEAIASAIRNTAGCSLLDVDPGSSTNRTVYTFVGDPRDAVKGALAAAKVAYELINMENHEGEHPRMGALDVCPFIPVKNVTMEECIGCAKEFGQKLSEVLNVPVYLYGYAAQEEKRVALPSIRAGEYENLPKKLQDDEWKPDYGPAEFVPSWGATVTGARNFLIAYNVNLLSTKEQAHRIALDLRESGRGKDKPGKLKKLQGIGWYLDEENLAQVSTNILDYSVTPLHIVFEEVKQIAEDRQLPVVGSQIVGLVPLDCILQASRFYIEKEKLFILDEGAKVRLAIQRLGLNSLGEFDPNTRIIDFQVRNEKSDYPLGSLSLRKFISTVGSRTPAPGGGSVSAAVASMGAALATMGGLLTYGKKQWESLDDVMRKNIPPVFDIMEELVPLIDRDAKAFDDYMAALKMPKKTEEEQNRRSQAMQRRILKAIEVPKRVIELVNRIWPFLIVLAEHSNITCASDVQVAAKCLETGAWGAYQNVLINLQSVKDETVKGEMREDVEKQIDHAQTQCKLVLEEIAKRLK